MDEISMNAEVRTALNIETHVLWDVAKRKIQ
jgi:hypothetical protein